VPEGQFTGGKDCYVYVDDSDNNIVITRDVTLAELPGTGLMPFTNQVVQNKPVGFSPRVVFWQGVLNGKTVRKELIVNRTGTLYTTQSQHLTVDGVDGSTTGYRGEKLTFACQADPTPDPP
jgi:hypothetical protein